MVYLVSPAVPWPFVSRSAPQIRDILVYAHHEIEVLTLVFEMSYRYAAAGA
jgi:hypothetical protein